MRPPEDVNTITPPALSLCFAVVHVTIVQRLLCGAVLLLGLAEPVHGQSNPASLDPSRSFAQYTLDVWQRAQGLPQNTIMSLAQTSNGYLWIATQDGLVRFDGVRFAVFDTRNTAALAANDIHSLLRDRHDRLWIGTAGGGLAVLENGRFRAIGTAQGLPSNVVSALHEDSAGAIWIGMRGGGVSRLAGDRLDTYTVVHGLASNDVTAIAQDHDGRIWVGTHAGLSTIDAGGNVTRARPPGLPSADIRALCQARDGSLWISTTRGVARLDDGDVDVYTTANGLSNNFARAILEDAGGTIWIATSGGGVTRVAQGRMSSFQTRDGLSDDDVNSLLEDDEGNLWIGTNSGGLNRLKNPQVLTYGTPEGLSHEVALGITEDRHGGLWVATYGGGLNLLRNGRWSRFSTADGLSSDIVLSLAASREGGVWVGTRRGVDRILGGRIQAYGPAHGLAAEPVLSLLEDSQGALWIGTRAGLRHLRNGRVTLYGAADGLRSSVITAILQRRDGAIWVGTDGGGLSRFDGTRFHPYTTKNGFPNDVVWTMTEDADGALWIGTNGGGLVRLANGRFSSYTTREGLLDDAIYRVLDDESGNLWMSSSRGIFRLRRRDLEPLDAGQLSQIPIAAYDEADGMRSREANGGIQPAGWRSRDGRLWFPTIRGVVLIEPHRVVQRSRPPRVLLEDILVDQRRVDASVPLRLAAGTRTLELNYTAPGFQAPHRTAFRYRLDGYDAEWVDAGTRRTAYYTNLPPGEYVFRVIAGSAGLWNDTEATVSFRIAPRFHQTAAFYVLCGFAVLLVGLALHRARVSGLRLRERELVGLSEERQRALEALETSEQRYRTLVDNVFEGVYLTSPDGRFLLTNRAFRDLLGYTEGQLAAVRADDLYASAGDRARLLSQLRDAGEVREAECVLRTRDGRLVTVLESARAVRDDAGRMMHIEGTLFDITARKVLEDQNRQLQKMEVVGRLAGGVAHDFNNLLTPILGYCDVLTGALPDAHQALEDVEEIRRAAESAASLTRQLLTFSRQEVVEPAVVQINEIARRMHNMLRRLIGEHLDLQLQLDERVGWIRADAGQIEQVLLNLAVNARDAMPDGGTLTVGTAEVETGTEGSPDLPAGRYVVLSVSDTGIGIAPDVQARMFQPFFTTKRHGTGLGLSTVSDIVAHSGGRVTVDSAPGRGSTFRAYFPRVERPLEQVAAPTSGPRRGTETILLAEDNDGLRELARKVLHGHGYTVLAAMNAAEARSLAAAQTRRLHLLLTDVVMPGGSGPKLAAELLEGRPDLKVLYMTGYLDADVAALGGAQARLNVIQKPFRPATLLARVRETLDAPDPPSR